MESKIKIFECGKAEGIFSKNKKFYPDNLTKSEITKQFNEVKKRAGEHFDFDDKKVIQATQKYKDCNFDYPDGKYVVLNETHMQKKDYWKERIEADILILEEKYKGVVLGNQMADCPIVIAEDRKKGVTALAHCGASYIDRLLPQDIIKALRKEYNSNLEDIYVYIGSSAKKDTYIYDKYPYWAINKELWKDNLEVINGNYHIDMNGAIIKQLKELGIKNIEESPINTMIDDRYYSHAESSKGNKDKLGQNFVGFYYI
ncbi:MAG: laccase domain-containing protein [Bacilli bacterium]|nr:laccase domain-containing protein [Bacilli bacterium]